MVTSKPEPVGINFPTAMEVMHPSHCLEDARLPSTVRTEDQCDRSKLQVVPYERESLEACQQHPVDHVTTFPVDGASSDGRSVSIASETSANACLEERFDNNLNCNAYQQYSSQNPHPPTQKAK
jgi:hypothetical protein